VLGRLECVTSATFRWSLSSSFSPECPYSSNHGHGYGLDTRTLRVLRDVDFTFRESSRPAGRLCARSGTRRPKAF